MQDLTFGEQVKIILSRKDMTIKELARKVEARTGKKMSRQNLTQRLGRDNFQERDMRMIAEILGCPFQLNILDERTITESETQTGQSAGTEAFAASGAGQSEGKDLAEPKEAAAEKEVSDKAASGEGGEKEQPEGKVKPKESHVQTHERDITIGELVDIHEELDALMQKAAGEAKAEKEFAGNGKAPAVERDIRDIPKEGDEHGNSAHDPDEHPQGNEAGHNEVHPQESREGHLEGYSQGSVASHVGERPQDNEAGHLEGRPQGSVASHIGERSQESKTGYIKETGQESKEGHLGETGQESKEGHLGEHVQGSQAGLSEGNPQGRGADYPDEKVRIKGAGESDGQLYAGVQEQSEEYGGRTQAIFPESHGERVYTGYSEVYGEGNSAEYLGEPESGHVEELLQVIESLEKTEKKEPVQEEKPHGWRAYLKQRFKKLGREQSRTEKETADSGREPGVGGQGQRESQDGALKNGYLKENDPEGGQMEGGRIYGESYSGGEYIEGGYERSHFSGEFSVESYGEDGLESEYSARAYVGGYSENGYSENQYSGDRYEEEYLNVGYPEEMVQEEELQEDEEDKGDMNPYTGKEYETNSVRMHPSRIGYVQVYDRANHQWTDMTEWAFLGYQERKKQLLGKDYDPPIYLD